MNPSPLYEAIQQLTILCESCPMSKQDLIDAFNAPFPEGCDPVAIIMTRHLFDWIVEGIDELLQTAVDSDYLRKSSDDLYTSVKNL